MMIYALGRALEPCDMPLVRRSVRNAAADNYRFETILTGIVKSRPFQMRVCSMPVPAVLQTLTESATVATWVTPWRREPGREGLR